MNQRGELAELTGPGRTDSAHTPLAERRSPWKEQDLQLRFRPFRISVYRLRPCIFQRAVAIHRKPAVAEVEGRDSGQ
jgi:hypothetical protein